MPFVKVIYNCDGSFNEAEVSTLNDELAAEISRVISTALGKPEAYVCVSVDRNPHLLFGGTKDPAAMISVQSIGTVSIFNFLPRSRSMYFFLP